MRNFVLKSTFVYPILFVMMTLLSSCHPDNPIDNPVPGPIPDPDPKNPEVVVTGTIFPAVVQMDQEKVSVKQCDTVNGQYKLSFNETVPDIKKGSVVLIEDNVVLVTDAKVNNKEVDIKGKLGDLSYVFHNVSFTLCTNEDGSETKGPTLENVIYPQTIINGKDTLNFEPTTRGDHSFYGDDFRIWDKTYSETASIYKGADASIIATPTLSSSLNVAFVLEFLDETTNLIDDIAFLKAKQFNFTGRLYGDLTTALNVTADIKKSGSHNGTPTRVVEDLLPKMKMKFQIGVIPFWIVMGCDLFAKVDMEYEGDMHFEQDMSATYIFEEGVKYMPYSAYSIDDKWKRFDVSKDIPAPVVSGKASWTGKLWVYPRFYADVDYIIGPSFEIKPYLNTNISVGFSEGNSDLSKNYLANTARADIGIEAAVGISSFLENVGVNPDLGMHDFGTIEEWNIIKSPSSIRLVSSSTDKVKKGQPLTLKFQVNQKNFNGEIPSPFFPIVKIEIPKTNEYYYCFAGTNGQVEFNRIPKYSDEIINAMVFDASGQVVDMVQFGDGKIPDPTVTTGNPYNIGSTSVIIPLSWDAEAIVKEVGIYYSNNSSNPTFTDRYAKGTLSENEVLVYGLMPSTHYFARAYAKIETDKSSEVVLGNVVDFTTLEEEKPDIELDMTSIDFGNVMKGETSKASFVISNTGSADLNVNLYNNNDVFSIDCSKTTIIPGGTKRINVSFTPDRVSDFSSTITIESNAVSGNKTVSLKGKGIANSEDTAQIELSKSELNFGSVVKGQNKSLSISVKNTGTADLKVSLSDPDSPFSLNWKEDTIEPNSSKTLTVKFAPDEESDYGAVVRFSSNASNGTKYLNLTGKGIPDSSSGGDIDTAPVIELSSSSLSFGKITVGESGTSNLTIKNTGDKPLNIQKITVPGDFTAEWSSASIASGASKVLKVTFKPSMAKTYSGDLVIESDASNGTSKVVSLSGIGVAKPEPKLSVSPSSIDFGNQIKFTQETKTITINNSGTGSLEISSITKTSNYGDLFTISGWTSGGSIAAGASKTITVSFQPVEDKEYEETLTIVSSNSTNNKKVSVTLKGTGVPEPENAIIKLSNSSISLGDVEVEESVSKSFTVSNIGTTDLKISSIKIVSSDNTQNPQYFTISPSGACTIYPNKSKSFTVTFSPESVKNYNAVVSIKSNATNSTNGTSTVSLSGNGVAATSKVLSASPASISFGMQTVGNRTSKNFTVKNTGTKAVTIYSLSVGDGFDLSETLDDGYNIGLAAGSSRTFSIAFAPTQAKSYNSSIVIKSNASNGDLNIPVSGTGAEAQGYLEIVSGETLDFGNVNVGSSGALYTKIRNTGDAPIKILGIDCPDGFSATSSVSSISAGYNGTISVYFAPTQVKAYSGSIIVRTDAENSSIAIGVSGNGKQSSSSSNFVDMGLSVKWANTNIGASKPEEYGQYVAWAETEPKNQYKYNNYKYYDANSYFSGNGYITKYCNSSSMGYNGHVDALSMLTYDDDFAQAKLGGLARIPTRKEWEELYKNCEWLWTSRNGTNGYLVTSKINGNSIFLPASGLIDGYNEDVNSVGYYWTSTLHYAYEYAYTFELRPDKAWYSYRERYKGLTVRAVEDYTGKPMIYTYTNSISFPGVKIGTSSSQTIAITNNGKGTLHISNISSSNRCEVDWTSASIDPGSYKMLTITYTPLEDPDLVVDDPETWDYRTVSIVSDARNGTGSDNSYILYIKGYGVK